MKKKIKLSVAHHHNGQELKPGAVIEVSEELAATLVAQKIGAYVAEEKPKKESAPAPAPVALPEPAKK